MRVIIAGGRTFNNYELLCNSCDRALINQKQVEIVSGVAAGADKLGERYARDRGYCLKQFPANWNEFGKSAGYRRNEQMAQYADALIAFWDGNSRGTKHMIELAKTNKLKLKIINY